MKENTMLKVLSELMKNSKVTDRELGKKLGISQLTVTRTRRKLEEEGYIKEYTIIPDFAKLGYGILAINLFKYEQTFDAPKIEKAKQILKESLSEGPYEMVMAERGMGLGFNAILMSFHKDYASLAELKNWARQFASFGLEEIESFLVNLNDAVRYKPLTFSTLAKHLLMPEKEKE